MSNNYKWGIIDASYFLRRNFSAIKYNSNLVDSGYASLISSFLSTVINYKNNLSIETIILAFDSSPYKKSVAIERYKKDRKYISEDDLTTAQNKLAIAETEEQKEKAQKELKSTKYNYDCEQIFKHSKRSILSNLNNSHFNPLIVSGYESDDLAYLTSKYILKNYGSDDLIKSVLVSVDTDWLTYINPKVDYYKENARRSNGAKPIIHEYKNLKRTALLELTHCSLYESGLLRELYYGGHNNCPAYNSKHPDISLERFAWSLLKKDGSIPSYLEYLVYFDALNMNMYDNSAAMGEIEKVIKGNRIYDNIEKISGYFHAIKLDNMIAKYKSIIPKEKDDFIY